MTTSTGASASVTSAETSESATSTTLSTSSTQPIPSPTVAAPKSMSDTKPSTMPVTDASVRPLQQQQPQQQQQPPRVPILPAVMPSGTNTKASIMSSSVSTRVSATAASSVSSNGNSGTKIAPSAITGAMETMNPVAGVAPNIGSFGAAQALQPMANKTTGNVLPPPGVPTTEDRSDNEPMWDRAPDFDELLSDSDDLNAHPGHSGLESNAHDSFYHGFLNSSTRSSPAMVHNPNEPQMSISRQTSSASSKSFTPVEHRPSQNIPPRHPMPMAPPYLPPTMPPYGMPSPYPWMPSMPPPWMQPMGPMGRMGMDSFSDAFSAQTDSTDFGSEMNFDDLGSDDRSFSSLLLGSDSDDIGLGRRSVKSLESARGSTSGYRQNPSMPYSSGMGGYPYPPYPYNMSQGGYYPPLPPVPPHHSSNPSSQGSSSSLNRGYIPMHYPTPMSASHMGLHPGYMAPPGMMPTYDMSAAAAAAASSAGRSSGPGKKNEFDLKDN